jgi:hypothetical protein
MTDPAPQVPLATANPPQTINDYRRRILAGEDISPEELNRAVSMFRSNRNTAVVAKAEARASKAPLDIASLFAPREPKAGS